MTGRCLFLVLLDMHFGSIKPFSKKGGRRGALWDIQGSAGTWLGISQLLPQQQRLCFACILHLPLPVWGPHLFLIPQSLAHLLRFWPISLLGRRLSTSCQEALGVCVKHSKLISGLLGCVIHSLNSHRSKESWCLALPGRA